MNKCIVSNHGVGERNGFGWLKEDRRQLNYTQRGKNELDMAIDERYRKEGVIRDELIPI